MVAEEAHEAHAHADTLDQLVSGTAVGLGVGIVHGAISSAWVAKPEVGQRTSALLFNTAGNIARSGGALAAVGAIFATTKVVAGAVRGTDDAFNSALAGCAAGAMAGVKHGSGFAAVGGCALGGVLAGTGRMAVERSHQHQKAFSFLHAAAKEDGSSH